MQVCGPKHADMRLHIYLCRSEAAFTVHELYFWLCCAGMKGLQKSINRGQQTIRDTINTVHQQTFYPIDEAFTDSVSPCSYGSTVRSGGDRVFCTIFTTRCDFIRSLFVRVKCKKNTCQHKASGSALMLLLCLKAEGQMVTAVICNTKMKHNCRVFFSLCVTLHRFERFTATVLKLKLRVSKST